MISIAKPVPIEPAFENREQIRSMIRRFAPYRAIATYAPDGISDRGQQGAKSVLPWFRGNWAVGGKLLVDGAEMILHNRKFLEAARTLFPGSRVQPENVFVNINAPTPSGAPHVDGASFRGATREDYPLPFLRVMGLSGLFEEWRVIQVGAISWFYDGMGGSFDYWPEGLDGPMLSEQPPFGNVAIVADNDRMYHRISAIGEPDAALPRMTASAEIRPAGDDGWVIVENGEVRATYPNEAIRLSVLWKASVQDAEARADHLTLDRILATFAADLRSRGLDLSLPPEPLVDRQLIIFLQECYCQNSAEPARSAKIRLNPKVVP